MTRVALFGCGWIQDFHARGVLVHPDGELVAVANHREGSAWAFADRNDIPRVTTDRAIDTARYLLGDLVPMYTTQVAERAYASARTAVQGREASEP